MAVRHSKIHPSVHQSNLWMGPEGPTMSRARGGTSSAESSAHQRIHFDIKEREGDPSTTTSSPFYIVHLFDQIPFLSCPVVTQEAVVFVTGGQRREEQEILSSFD